MLTTTIQDNSERLQTNKPDTSGNFAFMNVKKSHALEYRGEYSDVINMCDSIKKDQESDIERQLTARSERWARKSNLVGRVTGMDTPLSFAETTKSYTEKSKLKDVLEFGDLRSFDVAENDTFLEEISNDIPPEIEVQNDHELDRSDLALVRARDLVDQLAKQQPISDNRFAARSEQFILAA